MKSVQVIATSTAREKEARIFAKEASLPYAKEGLPTCDYLIVFEEKRIGIKLLTHQKTNLFYLDFASSQMTFRTKTATKTNELLAKAVGLRGKQTLTVLDATAGLGRDAWILASLGAKVTLIERSPILALLLKEALSSVPDSMKERMQLLQANAIDWLHQHLNGSPFPVQVIYLDPMFPERVKSAAVKKEMLILRDLVGEDHDAETLFNTAFACPVSRIVVKRPIHAHCVSNVVAPTFSVTGRANRFDVYIKQPHLTL